MLKFFRIIPAALVLGAGSLLHPASVAAQACAGIPLEQRRSAASGEVAFSSTHRMYVAGYARELTGVLALRANYAHASVDLSEFSIGAGNGTGDLVSSSLIYDLASADLPICSIGELGVFRSSAGANSPSKRSGALAAYGLGLGRTFSVGDNSSLTPFAVAQARMGLVCRGCATNSPRGALLHGRAESGLTVTFDRLYIIGAYRLFINHDPLFWRSQSVESSRTMVSVAAGLAF